MLSITWFNGININEEFDLSENIFTCMSLVSFFF